MRLLRTIFPLLLLLMSAGISTAGDFIPLPTFSNYEIQSTQNPQPKAQWQEYLDVAALAVALSLASYLALKKRSRRGLFLLSIASLAWFGFWRQGCICSIGAIQNVSLAVFDMNYFVPMSAVAFFLLPLIFTLFFGRTFCASVCPLGAIQELVAIRPVQTPVWLDHVLGLFAYIYLGLSVLFAATGTAFIICRYDPFVGLFRQSASFEMLVLGGCFLVVGFFIGRPYCRFFCPYGAILGWLSKLSKWHVTIPPDSCIQCRLCEASCPYGAIREPTVIPHAADRTKSRRRLATLLLLAPMLVVLGGVLGWSIAAPLARINLTVRLAEYMYQEQTGKLQISAGRENDSIMREIEAFHNTGRAVDDLNSEASAILSKFRIAGLCFGIWTGLVIGIKLIHLSIRRRRTDYEPDPAGCVSCGRCFSYCPTDNQLPLIAPNKLL